MAKVSKNAGKHFALNAGTANRADPGAFVRMPDVETLTESERDAVKDALERAKTRQSALTVALLSPVEGQ